MARTRKSILAEAAARFGSDTVRNVQASVITDMQSRARALAKKLHDRAGDVKQAADTIASIARDEGRSEMIDGPLWEKAAQILKDEGLSVPRSADYTWHYAPSKAGK